MRRLVAGRARTVRTRSSSSISRTSTSGWRGAIKRLGIPVVYYISPQIWAWRPKRLETIRRFADLVLVIFPFEEAIYRDAGRARRVRRSSADRSRAPAATRSAYLRRSACRLSAPTVAILPGSRPNEVRRILPDLMVAATMIRLHMPSAQFLVARAPNLRRCPFRVAVGGRARR